MPNQNASSSSTQQSPAQVLSPEARKALRKALKDQLSVVQKKVRHMQAKRLLGVKDDSPDEDKTGKTKGVKHAEDDASPSSMADRENHRRGNPDRRKGDRNDSEETGGKDPEGNARGGKGPAEDLKSEAETFFSKGTRPKTGKTKSVFASIMSSEQRSFAQDHKKTPSAQPTKRGGGGRKK